jgi:kumamolisin
MPRDPVEDLVLNYDPENPQPRLVGRESPVLARSTSDRLPRPVPWPSGLEPKAAPLERAPAESDDLSRFAGYDAVVVTWTSAEAAALAAMFTPDYLPSQWYDYRHDVDSYIPLVTGGDAPFNDKSPDMVRYYHSLGLYFPCTIGSRRILLFKSGLHLDYDGPKLPLHKLVGEMVAAVRPKVFITTGTAGGIGKAVALSDVVIGGKTRFYCTGQFKNEPFAGKSFKTSSLPSATLRLITPDLLSVNASLVPNARKVPKIWSGDDATIVTTDFFGFDDSTDYYKLEGKGQVCEMGDAMVGDALARSGVDWFAIRNASDPQIPNPKHDIEAAKQAAGKIYLEYGAFTTAASAIGTWATLVGYFGMKSQAARGTAGARTIMRGSKRHAVPSARLIGAADPSDTAEISVYLRRNPAGYRRAHVWLETQNARLPRDRKYLSGRDFDVAFGADPNEVSAVSAWLRAQGLRVTDESVTKRRVWAQGNVADIESAFSIRLNTYEHPVYGRFRGREGHLSVPTELASAIKAVVGLDTRHVGKPRMRRSKDVSVPWQELAAKPGRGRGAGALADLGNHWPGTFFPPQVATLYDYPAGDGSGQNIAVFAFNSGPHTGGYSAAALQTYFERVLGLKMPTIQNVVVHGSGNTPGPDTEATENQGDATGEVMLDMCIVGSLVPGAKMFMYFTDFNTRGWVDALHEVIANDNDIAVASISYGNPEDDPDGLWTSSEIDLVNEALQAASARGITICVASGDDGSGDGVATGAHVDFPASSPYVWGVGGTKLVGTGSRVTSETVWNETRQDDGAGGGGISTLFTKPTYQDSVSVPRSVNPPHHIGRGVPDGAAVADPLTGVAVMHVNGEHLDPVGGTSAAAPLWASLIVRINAAIKGRCGFINELMYTKFASRVLRDITVGNNGSYAAGPGWDACSGLGAPGGSALQKALGGSVSARAASGRNGATTTRRARATPARRARTVR